MAMLLTGYDHGLAPDRVTTETDECAITSTTDEDAGSVSAAHLLWMGAPLKLALRGIKLLCLLCRQEFESKSEMTRHSKEVHRLEEKGHKCPKCFKSFPTSQQLAQHSLVHSNIRKYQCQFCDKTFKQLSHVQQHQRIHTEFLSPEVARKYRCKYCDKGFKQLAHVQRHQRIHTGERPYKCHFEGCGKAFVQLSGLTHHLKNPNLHTAQIAAGQSAQIPDRHPFSSGNYERPYKCTIGGCNKVFAQSCNLEAHLKSHEDGNVDKKPFACNICNRCFATEASLNHHISKVHNEVPPRMMVSSSPSSSSLPSPSPSPSQLPWKPSSMAGEMPGLPPVASMSGYSVAGSASPMPSNPLTTLHTLPPPPAMMELKPETMRQLEEEVHAKNQMIQNRFQGNPETLRELNSRLLEMKKEPMMMSQAPAPSPPAMARPTFYPFPSQMGLPMPMPVSLGVPSSIGMPPSMAGVPMTVTTLEPMALPPATPSPSEQHHHHPPQPQMHDEDTQ